MGSFLVLAVLVALAVAAVAIYNRIIMLENRYRNAWSQIDVQLKRRNDLLPNLVETVRSYATHEREVFDEVSRSRERLMGSSSIADSADAANEMTAALGRLFAVAEAYPELRANENFRALQEELSSVEGKIAYARQFYNDSVLQYNNVIRTIPGVWFAGPMGRSEQVFLAIPETERAVPAVSFS